MDIYQKAWQRLLKEIQQGKTSWGKNELQQLMLDCLVNPIKPAEPELPELICEGCGKHESRCTCEQR